MPDVFIPLPVAEVETMQEAPSMTYHLDLDRGRISEKIDGIEAVNQAIRKAIITPRFKCLIYDNQYGSEIEEAIIAGDATQEYIETVIEGFVTDCLKPDTRILSVYDFSVTLENDSAYISFKADTIFGETTIEEVISGV
ncbi:MAG: DUF2634 domain-containing protein [Alistipes sp.]|nr:DUF2634 domain-containing protein [Alistipes sp.]